MDVIKKAIKQIIFERLKKKYRCFLNPDYKDCTYLDYSNSIGIELGGNHGYLMIMFRTEESKSDDYGIRIIWSEGKSTMGYETLLLVPEYDIAEPNLETLLTMIEGTLVEFYKRRLHWTAYLHLHPSPTKT